MAQRLIDPQGRPLTLGAKLGAGGEGAVYRLADQQDLAVKVYNDPLTPERALKIRTLSALPRNGVQSFTAWPAGLVTDADGRARGLLLPVIEQAKDVHHLYNPGSRKATFPAADWRFLVHVAGNVARAFAAVHALGLVIGDVNHGSVLVARNGTVKLIDIDSFQVPVAGSQPLLCTVAVPHFLPPELYNAPLDKVVRTAQHDAFGLAVMIFQLLMLGRHPYAGRYLGSGEMPIERAIPEHRFAFSKNAAARQMERPPHTVGLDIFPAPVADLFEAAFAADAPQRGRPTAPHWVAGLDQLGQSLVTCRQNDSHHYARHLTTCPWCGFETTTGVFLFKVPSAGGTVSRAEGEYAQLSALIAAVRPPARGAVAPLAQVAHAPATAAVEAAGTTKPVKVGYGLAPLLALIGVILLPDGWFLIALGALALVLAVAGSRRRRAPWASAYRHARAEHAAAEARLEHANTFPSYSRASADVARGQGRWAALPGIRAQKYRELEANKRNEQLQQHLSRHLIEHARISGIGRGRVATLSAYGINTAGDIDYGRVSQVPQFGDVLTQRLVQWRLGVERAFVYDPKKPLAREAVARVEQEIEDARRRVINDLRRDLQAVRHAAASDAQAAEAAARGLAAARGQLRQAEADAMAALGKLPS